MPQRTTINESGRQSAPASAVADIDGRILRNAGGNAQRAVPMTELPLLVTHREESVAAQRRLRSRIVKVFPEASTDAGFIRVAIDASNVDHARTNFDTTKRLLKAIDPFAATSGRTIYSVAIYDSTNEGKHKEIVLKDVRPEWNKPWVDSQAHIPLIATPSEAAKRMDRIIKDVGDYQLLVRAIARGVEHDKPRSFGNPNYATFERSDLFFQRIFTDPRAKELLHDLALAFSPEISKSRVAKLDSVSGDIEELNQLLHDFPDINTRIAKIEMAAEEFRLNPDNFRAIEEMSIRGRTTQAWAMNLLGRADPAAISATLRLSNQAGSAM